MVLINNSRNVLASFEESLQGLASQEQQLRAAIEAALAEKAALQSRIEAARTVLTSEPEYTLTGLAELRGSMNLHGAILGWEVASLLTKPDGSLSHLVISYRRRNGEM